MKLHSHASISDSGPSRTGLEHSAGARCWGCPPPHYHYLLLGAIVSFLPVTSESSSGPVSSSRRRSQILYQDMNCFCVQEEAALPDECIRLIFSRRVCASVADCPHPTFHGHCKDTPQERFVIPGLLLILTRFPLSPAKSFIEFLSCICHFVQTSMNKPKCK